MSPVNNAFSSLLAGSVNIPLVHLDENRVITFANPAFKAAEGNDVEGKAIHQLFKYLDTSKPLPETFRANLYTNSPAPVTHTAFCTVDNQSYSILFEPQVDDSRQLQQQVTQLNNELSNVTRDTQQKNARLEKLNQIKNELIGMAAHDLRTPIANIFAFSELALLDADKLSIELHEYLGEIKALSEFMLDVLNDLLDLAVIESGTLKLQRAPASISQIIHDSIRLFSPLAKKKNISIHLNLGPDLQKVNIDALKIKQAINNLVSNAIKYGEDGGWVKITTMSNETLEVTVSDNGPGIAESDLTKIFRPFYTTGNDNRKRPEKSAGLGLAISKKIVNAHGGHLEVTSIVEKGTTFHIKLPI